MPRKGRRNSFSIFFRKRIARRVENAPNGMVLETEVFSIADQIDFAAERLREWANSWRGDARCQARILVPNLNDLADGLKEISDRAAEVRFPVESDSAGTGQSESDETA